MQIKDKTDYTIAEELLYAAEVFLAGGDKQRKEFEAAVQRTEFGSSSSMHRGYYCPSTVRDIVVGNANRGKLLKRVTAKSKNFFVFGFDEHNKLIVVKKYCNGELGFSEFLIYKNEAVFGVGINRCNKVDWISREIYGVKGISSYQIGYTGSTKKSPTYTQSTTITTNKVYESAKYMSIYSRTISMIRGSNVLG